MTVIGGKAYWLIGASEGMGREVAKLLASDGAELILSARNRERLQELRDELGMGRVVPLDVTDADSIAGAVDEIGLPDALIYNAGAYYPMPTDEWDSAKALTMCDVNFMGAMRVLGEVVPKFVERGSGEVTLVGSLAAYRGLPKSIGYSASKAGIASLAETMRRDLKGSGVTVRLVNPGFIRTRLTDKNQFRMPMLMEPEDAAERVVAALKSSRFRTDFPAPFSWLMRGLRCVPDWLYFAGGGRG
ncbi:SDR family oxidoreductase [Pseudoruegeria sp. HB172150]|uniref:SDR family NAD(P)-dependent oxidoreductase n=1 Tax=Pseudoruegeria sp. HB172150 TaxID=2721164 RepID=UPI001557171F|nr:SDR family NAD(P)-dependent oxidoreductase [Pseudoruegeria sp. HB172150]